VEAGGKGQREREKQRVCYGAQSQDLEIMT